MQREQLGVFIIFHLPSENMPKSITRFHKLVEDLHEVNSHFESFLSHSDTLCSELYLGFEVLERMALQSLFFTRVVATVPTPRPRVMEVKNPGSQYLSTITLFYCMTRSSLPFCFDFSFDGRTQYLAL